MCLMEKSVIIMSARNALIMSKAGWEQLKCSYVIENNAI